MHETLITPAGLTRMGEELERLRTLGRRAIVERIRCAMSTDADSTANADYQAAREEHALLEARIARLEERLANARVAEPDATNDVVDLGERVGLHDMDTGAHLEYELVGSFEADLSSYRISSDSPLGRALIGRRCGEVAVFETPQGERRLRILAVTQPSSAADR
jgi:transcription elongation factor GreA